MTYLKVEAHGHLGDFSKEYFLEEGKELNILSHEVFKDLTRYVMHGKQKIVLQIFKELALIEKETKKGEVETK